MLQRHLRTLQEIYKRLFNRISKSIMDNSYEYISAINYSTTNRSWKFKQGKSCTHDDVNTGEVV